MKHLARDGHLILIVTHDYEFMTQTCSRVMALDSGRVQWDKPWKKIDPGNKLELMGVGDTREQLTSCTSTP